MSIRDVGRPPAGLNDVFFESRGRGIRHLAAAFAIADPIKLTVIDAIAALHKDGIRVIKLTGDNRTSAEAVARQLGIDEVEAKVLPAQKSAVVNDHAMKAE